MYEHSTVHNFEAILLVTVERNETEHRSITIRQNLLM